MDLEDLKNNWEALDQAAEQHQELLGPTKTQSNMIRKYHSRIHRITFWEVLLSLGGIYFSALFTYQFDVFTTPFLMILGTVCIILLILIPGIRLYSVVDFYRLIDPTAPTTEVYEAFAKSKKRFFNIQKFNAGLGLLLLTSIIVLSTKVYREFAVTSSKLFWMIVLFGSLAVVSLVHRFLLKRYQKAIDEAEAWLQELE